MFRKATKSQAKLRLAISGPSGSGKTFTALTLGKTLGKRMAVIDTERGSASKYAGDVAEFDSAGMELFSVQNYLKAIGEAAAAGYDVLVIDSLSHAWSGRGGILEEADKMGGKFSAWAKLTPLQQKLIDAILSYPGHVIATMRSKTEYQVTVEEGKNGTKQTKVEKLGLAPVQRDDVSYEFDVMLDMNDRNVATVTKSRCSAIAGQSILKPGQELAETLLVWLTDGAEVPQARHFAEAASSAQTRTQTPTIGQTPTQSSTTTETPNENRNNTPAPAVAQAPAAAQSSEPARAPGIDKDAAIKSLVEVDLPRCTTKDHLVSFARELLSVHGPVRGTAPWKSFAEHCANHEIAPRDVVSMAQECP